MTKRMLTMLLAAVILLSANGCAPTPDTAENSSSSSVTTEELQVLQEENEKLKQELAELKGEKQDAEVEGEEPKEEVETESSTASEPASKPTAPAANNQAAKPQAEKPAANNTQTAAKPQTPAPQKTSSGKGPLAKYTVNVSDSSTPAVKVVGETLNGKSAYYFYSSNDKLLGNIPIEYLTAIIRENGLSDYEADEQKAWFVENFNIYRGLDGGSYEGGSSNSGSSSSNEIDIEEFRQEVIRLTNIERENAGLKPYEVDTELMEFAQMRAKEISGKYSHSRPANSPQGPYEDHQYGENIAKGYKTPADAVNGWMSSKSHRAEIMDSEYNDSFGVGVYRADNGTFYWTQVFIGSYSRN